MIFPPIELPQYIVVPPTDCEMKDIIGYHNKHLTGKISNYLAFFEKCGYLLSAMYSNIWQPSKTCDTRIISLYSSITVELQLLASNLQFFAICPTPNMLCCFQIENCIALIINQVALPCVRHRSNDLYRLDFCILSVYFHTP